MQYILARFQTPTMFTQLFYFWKTSLTIYLDQFWNLVGFFKFWLEFIKASQTGFEKVQLVFKTSPTIFQNQSNQISKPSYFINFWQNISCTKKSYFMNFFADMYTNTVLFISNIAQSWIADHMQNEITALSNCQKNL